MKYFVDAETREASGNENYIEFQLPTATDEFWDKTSLYMLGRQWQKQASVSFGAAVCMTALFLICVRFLKMSLI